MKTQFLMTLALATTAAASMAHPCAEIADATARLACYDRAFPPKLQSPSSNQGPTSAAAPAAQQRFGLPPERKLENAPPSSISASLSGLEFRSDGARLFVLDNGQRWLETDSQRRGVAEVGDRVEIRAASFGSFMLITPARVGIRVRRLQ